MTWGFVFIPHSAFRIISGVRRLEETPGLLGVDRRRARLPVGRTDLAVLLEELQRVDHANRLVNAASERQVVDQGMPQDAVLVDQEGAAKGDAGAVEQHTVVRADLLGDV